MIVFSKDARLKRRLLPIFLTGIGGVFTAVVWVSSPLGPAALILVPILAFAFYVFQRSIRFCDVCGKTVTGAPFSRPALLQRMWSSARQVSDQLTNDCGP